MGNVECPFIAITPRSTLARCGSTWLGPIYGSNRTKLCTYAKLNCLKLNCFDIQLFGLHQLFYQLFAFFISWRLRRPHWGNADGAKGIWGIFRTRVGCGPASETHLKKALCRTCPVVVWFGLLGFMVYQPL